MFYGKSLCNFCNRRIFKKKSVFMDIVKYKSHDRILVAVDCIIFGFDGAQLKALLIKRGFEPEKGRWSLMGGFVSKNESADEAAGRVLHQLTGLEDVYMEQLHCFSDVDRDPAGRVISIAYFALINIEDYSDQLQADHEAKWFPLNKIPQLIFDHKQMVMRAKERLQHKVSNHPIGFELLPFKFTLPQLQSLYEAIYESPLDKRNFTRKILSLGILNKLTEKEKESSRKGAFYYVFDKNKYKKLHNEGVKFI
jgi:8-oxo-dGTP diphosphatase